VARFEGAERITPFHAPAGRHRRGHRLVGGAQPAGVRHRDDGFAGDGPGEHHHPGAGGEHRLTGPAGEVGAAVSG
jgi:hypothetical protein